MSDYRREQLLTYLAGPIVAFAGSVLAIVSIMRLIEAWQRACGPSIGLGVGGIGASAFFVAYGLCVIREGRRSLASDHWRAEHFQA